MTDPTTALRLAHEALQLAHPPRNTSAFVRKEQALAAIDAALAAPSAQQEPRDPSEAKGAERIWECKIGGRMDTLPPGADAPMRNAIEAAFEGLTGYRCEFNFSGWGGKLDELERAAVNKDEAAYARIALAAPSAQQPDSWWCRNCEAATKHSMRGHALCCDECHWITATSHAPFAQQEPENIRRAAFSLDAEEATLLADFLSKDEDGDSPATTLWIGDGHSGSGLYASLTEYPEEGSVLITQAVQASTAPQPSADRARLVKAVGNVVKTAPPKIWLNIFTGSEDTEDSFPDDHEGITWSEDEIGDADIAYVRADLAASEPKPQEDVSKLSEAQVECALDKWGIRHRRYVDTNGAHRWDTCESVRVMEIARIVESLYRGWPDVEQEMQPKPQEGNHA